MTDSRLYITLNRESEWRRCLLDGLAVSGNVIVPGDGGTTRAVMITGSADSSEYDFTWRDLLLDVKLSENTIMKVSAYCANTAIVSAGGRTIELDSFIMDGKTPAKERDELIAPLFRPLFTNCADGPVNLKGRYIWLRLEFIMLERRELTLSRIKLLYKAERMIDYLPEAYRIEDGENGFLTRFMSMFDGIFFDMDDKIERLPSGLDYRVAGGGLLRFLAQWVNVADYGYISDEELRERIRRAVSDYELIGTKRGLIRWIESEYGVTPNIIEYFDVKKMIREGGDREVYKKLFGDDPYKFFVVLPEDMFRDPHEANIFMDKLKARIPAHTQAEVVSAKDSIILGSHTYLGVNTVLNDYRAADTTGRIAHDMILGGEPPAPGNDDSGNDG